MTSQLKAEPILRIFNLGIDTTKQKEFKEIGEYNLTTSIKNEIGTLAMYSTFVKGNSAQTCILEIYEDDDAYQIHANSPQYKKYVEMAKDVVKTKNVSTQHMHKM